MTDKENDNNIPDEADFPTISSPSFSGNKNSSEVFPGVKGFRIIKKLGEGGMGIVYLAQQIKSIKRQVALKVIKPGMDSKKVIARFEAERQTLALLEHPNIARVYDAGTTELGRPYFVMEYIYGVSITDYCDHKKLNIEERLKLFIQVCEGIQHAHLRGIIHRDIKPSNILVSAHDNKAIPKVIDFGVAKATSQVLTEQTMFTEHGHLIGTPEYMSPEQADLSSHDIDIRTDIYSLGIVLYQLLTGALPFDPKRLRKAAYGEIQRIIRKELPLRPSTRLLRLGGNAREVVENRSTKLTKLIKRLNNELEWIPLMAIRKERNQRYQSASEFALDIKSYLKGDLLLAGPESMIYRFKKYVTRNIAIVAILLGFLVSFLLGLLAIASLSF